MSVAARTAAWQRRARNLPGPLAAPVGVQTGGKSPIDFGPNQRLRINTYLALGANLTADPSTWAWTDISTYVRYDPGVAATTARQDESTTVTPGRATLTVDNRDGRFSRKNPTGPYYGLLSRNTPILVTINAGSATYNAVQMFVNEWPARWDKTQTDFTVPITCGGILRRLGQGDANSVSPLYRTITSGSIYGVSTGAVASYWSLEDGAGTTQAIDPIGGQALIVNGSFGFTGADTTALPGSNDVTKPLPSSTAAGNVATFPSTWTAATGWSIGWFMNIPEQPATIEVILMEWWCNDATYNHWIVALETSGKVQVRSYNTAGVEQLGDTGTLFDQFTGGTGYGQWIGWEVDVIPGSPTLALTQWSSQSGGSFSDSQVLGHNPGQPTAIKISGPPTTNDEFSIGHVIVSPTSIGAGGYEFEAFGLIGERATTRIARLCSEQGIPLTRIGDSSDTLMGAQIKGSFLENLRDCEAADGGVLFESGFGVGYQTRSARYNAPVALALDVAQGHISDDLQPTDDDQLVKNRWTVTRTGGASSVASSSTSIALDGLHDDSKTVNVDLDTDLPHFANWLVHIGTQDDIRWPTVPLNFARTEALSLIDLWIQMQFGSRVTIANIPTQIARDTVDVFIEGKTETFNQFMWTATLNTTPAVVNDVFRIEARASLGAGSNVGRFGLSQTLAAPAGAADATLSVATASGAALLTTLAADFPMDWVVGGERITVTSVTGSSSPQTANVTRSVNGVVKTHNLGDSIDVYRPGVIRR